MTLTQQIITIGLCILGTMLTRFLPFLIFRENRKTPEVIQYIGEYLPAAVFGMLVVYCLRNVSIVSGSHGLPELIAILVTCGLHPGNGRFCSPLPAARCAICCCCTLYLLRTLTQRFRSCPPVASG
ncbi:MAG: branched-chain amino acid transporter permease [Ruminococcus sp.]